MLEFSLLIFICCFFFYAGKYYGETYACIPNLLKLEDQRKKYEDIYMQTETLSQKYLIAIEDAEEAKKYFYQEFPSQRS